MTKKVNVYRVSLMIIDHDDCGRGEIEQVLENARFPNRCLSPKVVGMEEREVEWRDDHALNRRDRTVWIAAFQRLFGLTSGQS